jgi:hypothetical protein
MTILERPNCSRSSTPSSRPVPVNFLPPNGIASKSFKGVSTQTMPVSISFTAQTASYGNSV